MFFYGQTDIGARRSSNQDCFIVTELYRNAVLGVVCDGMGGANGGNIASRLAVDVFEKTLSDSLALLITKESQVKEKTEVDLDPNAADYGALICDAAEAANSAVYARANANAELRGMGTTLVAALVIGNTMYAINIGDSRLYIASEGQLKQITRDHSYVQYLVDIGKITPEEAAENPVRNIITRSVGPEAEVEGDLYITDLSEYGEGYILMCSDGLTNFMTPTQITDTVLGESELHTEDLNGEYLRDISQRLVDGANEGGGGDNITVLLLRF